MAKRRAATAANDLEWAFQANDAAVLGALASGERAGCLTQYFGAEAYADLSRLARRAMQARRRAGPQVVILPGIMGSTLGNPPARRGGSPNVLWIDPERIARGGIREMALPAGRVLKPLGVLLLAYARLKLQLEIDGFDARLHPYDWRLGLDELGSELAAHIAAHDKPVILIGHSMGGMVARMAMGQLPRRYVRKLLLLGTPNFGSFAPILAIRGTYPFVRKVATLDPQHSPEFLARTVFRTFAGLYHLLPAKHSTKTIDLYEAASWPARGPRPDPRLLRKAATVRRALAAPDARMTQIVGVGQRTIIGVKRAGGQFVYELGLAGDGTVPLALARLPAVKTYYVEEVHANLTSNPTVVGAVSALLRRGRTDLLPRRSRRGPRATTHIDDAQLSRVDGPKIDWRRLKAADRDAVLAELNEGRPAPVGAAAAPAGRK